MSSPKDQPLHETSSDPPALKKPTFAHRFSFGTTSWKNALKFQSGGDFEDDDKSVSSGQINHPSDFEKEPLIGKSSTGEVKGASLTKTFINIVKSFVGTGMLFLPEGFLKGGVLLSSIALLIIALLALVTMLQLVECWDEVKGSFGEIGERAFGRKGKILVDVTLAVAQICFACVYVVFVAENLQAVIFKDWEMWQVILLEIPVLTPLIWIRRVYKLSLANFIGTIFILCSFVYIMYIDIDEIVRVGTKEVDLFNWNQFALFLGTAIFTFEGVGTVIPIQQSMIRKEYFKPLLTYAIFAILAFLICFAVVGYMAFGDVVLGPILKNLPQDDVMTKIILCIYAFAILFSYPLIIFPAVEILQRIFFDPSHPVTRKRTWQKNFFRFLIVCLTAVIAIAGGDDFSKFVSLVGAFCGSPLAFIYPPLFHYKIVAKTNFQKFIDISIAVIGVLTMFFSSGYAIWAWVKESTEDVVTP